ncbi:hypothetical protein Ahy_A07g037174 [Arachis hypogaea]|uniref:Uncharacterized protein n=1 Tax=Arachis hypogaea TaxID=3818 RepID=A0A445CI21_ARAHY|nr:hypothetical protein Ahy_A07g037174 [Arachis hypogaea]
MKDRYSTAITYADNKNCCGSAPLLLGGAELLLLCLSCGGAAPPILLLLFSSQHCSSSSQAFYNLLISSRHAFVISKMLEPVQFCVGTSSLVVLGPSALILDISLDIEVRVKYRLQSELMALMMSGDSGISAFLDEDNIFCWKGTITGSKDMCLKELSTSCHFRFPMITLLRLQRSNLKAPASIQT